MPVLRRVLLSALVLAALTLPACLSASAGRASPTFSVSGARILKNGSDFVIRGVSVAGPGLQQKRPTVQDLDLIADVWKFNLVRAGCSIARHPVSKEVNALDDIVRAFTAHGLVVLIDPRDHLGGYYQDPPKPAASPSLADLIAWYKATAARYRDNPLVWFEVMAGPGSREDRKVTEPWLETHEAVIHAIRNDASAPNIIVCEGRYRGSDAGNNGALPVAQPSSAILAYGPDLSRKYSNLLYGIHMDESWNAGEQKLNDFVDRVQAEGLPVFVSEYGNSGWADSTPASEAMLSVCKSRRMGRCAWCWYPTDNQQLCAVDGKGGGWEIDSRDGSKPANLSWLGDRVWDDNHGLVPLHGPPLDRSTWTATAFAAPTADGGHYNQADCAFSPYIISEDYWTSNKPQEPGQWFEIDMGARRTFSRLLVDPRARYGDYPRGYEVYVSNDGAAWGAPIARGKNDASVLHITVPTQTARYIKIVQTGKTWHHWVIANFEVYAPIGSVRAAPVSAPVHETPIEPRAWSATAGPNRWYDVEIPLRPLHDEFRYTGTSQAQHPGHFYQVDMGETQRFHRIVLNCGRSAIDYPRGYEVTVSSDGLEWSKPIASGRGAPVTTITFPTQQARFIRVTLTRYGRNYWALAEFRVYGDAAGPAGASFSPRADR
jgi:mannan endo-1,4-beta-mannosidase